MKEGEIKEQGIIYGHLCIICMKHTSTNDTGIVSYSTSIDSPRLMRTIKYTRLRSIALNIRQPNLEIRSNN